MSLPHEYSLAPSPRKDLPRWRPKFLALFRPGPGKGVSDGARPREAAVTPDLRRELERLASALCDGDLSDADRDRLDQLLAADAECRRLYLELIDLHAALLL